ncbi:MAG: hypothetical protein QOI01_7060 [Mycobacterium sp.]|jgi:hypothetical protein|nr:hypothetical protein [Mycobacterium sp.]
MNPDDCSCATKMFSTSNFGCERATQLPGYEANHEKVSTLTWADRF